VVKVRDNPTEVMLRLNAPRAVGGKVFGPDGALIAIVNERNGRARAEIVLAPATAG